MKIVSSTLALAILVVMFNWPYSHFSQGFNYEAEMFAFAGIEAFHKANRGEDGLKLLDVSLRLQEFDQETCSELGWNFEENAECDTILREYHVTLNAMSHDSIGEILMAKRDFAEAAIHFSEAAKIKTDDFLAFNNLGVAYTQLGNLYGAIKYLNQAIEINADYPLAHINLGIALSREHQFNAAIIQFLEGQRLNPDNPEIYFDLGITYAQNHQKSEAAKNMIIALKMNPLYKEDPRLMTFIALQKRNDF